MTSEQSPDGDNFKLDVVVAASGFGRKDMKILEEVGSSWEFVVTCPDFFTPSIWMP